MNFSITRNGKSLDPSLYTWDKENRTLVTRESGLVLDFSDMDHTTFITDWSCIFKTGHSCIFKTGSNCVFKTGHNCIFNTTSDCIFSTSSYCVFKTGWNCTFKTGEECVIIRRDVCEVIEIPENVEIKLNSGGIKGYTIIPDKETADEAEKMGV